MKWKYINGVSEEVMLEDIERYILSNDGSMIIKNVSQTDSRTFAAYDTVYGINKKVAEYNLEVIYSDGKKIIVKAGHFCPSLGAPFPPKIATFFPNTMSVFPNKGK